MFRKFSLVGLMLLSLLSVGEARATELPTDSTPCVLHLWGMQAKQIGGGLFVKVTPAPATDQRPTSISNATNPIQRLNAYSDEELRKLVPLATAARIIRHETLVDRSYLKKPVKAFAPTGQGCELALVLTEVSYTLPPPQSKGLVADLVIGGAGMRSAFLLLAFRGGQLTASYRDAASSPIKFAPGAWNVDPAAALEDMNAASLRNLSQFSSRASKRILKP